MTCVFPTAGKCGAGQNEREFVLELVLKEIVREIRLDQIIERMVVLLGFVVEMLRVGSLYLGNFRRNRQESTDCPCV